MSSSKIILFNAEGMNIEASRGTFRYARNNEEGFIQNRKRE